MKNIKNLIAKSLLTSALSFVFCTVSSAQLPTKVEDRLAQCEERWRLLEARIRELEGKIAALGNSSGTGDGKVKIDTIEDGYEEVYFKAAISDRRILR